MPRMPTVEECTVRDAASEYFDNMTPEQRLAIALEEPGMTNKPSQGLRDATDEERALVRRLGV